MMILFVKLTKGIGHKFYQLMKSLPSILVSMDVWSLCTNILHNDGVGRPGIKGPFKNHQRKVFFQLLTLILKHNNFTFNEEHIIQINRATMGTTMAPSYANFFMGKLEKQIIQSSPQKPFSWSRFIDDIDMKWTDSKENLHCFFDHANNVHTTIKFTHKTSRTNIWMLTIPVKMVFDIYNKPTDEHQYLSSQSCHPKHFTKSIPYGQMSSEKERLQQG
jgi:hypothetical protein